MSSTAANLKVAYFWRGKSYYYLELYELALNDLNQTIALDPFVNDYNFRRMIYIKLKLYQEAIVSFTKAIEIDEESFTYTKLFNRGVAYYYLKEYQAFENEELENKYIAHVQDNENLELGPYHFLGFADNIDFNNVLNIIGKYMVADMLFSGADKLCRDEKLVTVHNVKALANAEDW